MLRFLLGFVTASVLWGGVAALYFAGLLPFSSSEETVAQAADIAPETAEPGNDPKRKPRRKRNPRVRAQGADSTHGGEQQVGEDIGWDEARQVDMGGGEEQLSGAEIEAGFDSVLGRIRRCLILVPADGEINGKLIFGMRVGGDGRPRAVNLTGPSIVTGGESGSCLREAAQSIRFATFDGPDMLFKYPINLQ